MIRARLRAAGACLASAAVLAGCGATATSGTAVTAKGQTLVIYLSRPPASTIDSAQQQVFEAEQLACPQGSRSIAGSSLSVKCLTVSQGELSANARAAIQNQSSIAYIGELAPGESAQSAGITNALDLAQVSPTDTAAALTDAVSAVPGAPKRYYESPSAYGRTFARIAPTSTEEAGAQVKLMKRLGVRSLEVGNDGSDYGRASAQAVRSAAAAAGIAVQPEASGANAVFFGGSSVRAATAFVRAAGSTAKVFLPSGLYSAAAGLGRSAGVYVSSPGFAVRTLGSAGTTFASAFRSRFGTAPGPEAVLGYVAVSAVLHVLDEAGRKANDRARVVRDLHSLSGLGTPLGPLSIDSSGDSSLGQSAFVFSRLTGGRLVAIGPRK